MMKYSISTYQEILNLQNATFIRIDHKDTLFAVVYKITQASGEKLILKICDQSNDYLREVYFLNHFAKILPVPKIIQVVEPVEGRPGAILMEYLPGIRLQADDFTETLAYEIGQHLALIHQNRLQGYGDLTQHNLISDPKVYFTLKFEADLEECKNHLPIVLIKKCQRYFETHVDLLMAIDGPCITHRDFQTTNLIIQNGKLQGIIDWSGARASFAEEDFLLIEHQKWVQKPSIKKSFLSGYASIRPIPSYQHLITFLHLIKSIAIIAFILKHGTWENSCSHVYQYHRKFLETFAESDFNDQTLRQV